MNFKAEKIQSIQLLKIVFAILISAMPFIIVLGGEAGFYITVAALCAVLSFRVYEAKKIYMPIHSAFILIFFIYTLIASLWARDRAGHLLYISLIVAFFVLSSLFADYLNKNNDASSALRIMYMISVSASLIVLANIWIWLFVYAPEGKSYSFSAGFNSSAELGIFLILELICVASLIKRGSKYKKTLITMVAIFVFALIMTKSAVPFLFAGILGAMYLIRNKGKKTYLSMVTMLTVGFIAAFVINCINSPSFSDALRVGFTNPFGIGGGGFVSALQSYSSTFYTKAQVSLVSLVVSASGIAGLFMCVLVVIRQMYIAIKRCTWFSSVIYVITLFMLINPYNMASSSILMWAALVTYNESVFKPIPLVSVSKNRISKTVMALLVATVLFIVFGFEAIMKNTADSLYEREDYLGAYSWYKITATINIADDESCVRAAECLRKSGEIAKYEEEVIKFIDMAIRRSRNNAYNLSEKARVFKACGRLDRAVSQWEAAIAVAIHNDNYRLELSKTLYDIIKTSEKGSTETKEAYKKLLSVSEATHNLDVKKKINDIADKALIYTKGELKDEGETES